MAGRSKVLSTVAVIVKKNIYLKILLQKVFEIKTERSPGSLTAAVDGAADLSARNVR